ncbi:MAG: DUF1295 domain-containing protein [Alphaproteobacteria bacterium]|nr:DUF1295 domain-containing protein [Alphaproteobacteria bacterium]
MQSIMVRIGNFFFRYRNHAFPLVVLALFVLAVPPHEIFHSETLEYAKDFLALLLAFSGLALRALVIGYAYIKRGGLKKKVYAENLVTEGIFRLSRNPLYLGNMLIYSGVFLMHGNPMVMLAGFTFYLFVYQCIILAEEEYLRGKFGDAYDAYCADTPRWWPNPSRFREATEGMRFNLKRVIVKDYSTIANTFVTLTLTEMYEYLALRDISAHFGYLCFLGGMIALSAIMALTVQALKKSNRLSDVTPKEA